MLKWTQPVCREIFDMKYRLHGELGPDEIFAGIAEEIAAAEVPEKQAAWKERFYSQISSGKLIPAGRILANARPGSPMKNYNNCFTIDIEDSMEGIYDSLKEDALISKMGGGVGFDISRLRPRGDKLSKGGESSGVISFLRIFDQSAKTIMTGGQRRSAHIALLDISHPEVESFITAKQGDVNKELTQFNISVKITDDFMRAVRESGDWDLVFNNKTFTIFWQGTPIITTSRVFSMPIRWNGTITGTGLLRWTGSIPAESWLCPLIPSAVSRR